MTLILNPGDPPYTDLLEIGDAMQITAYGSALVEWNPGGGQAIGNETLATSKRYGPYARAMAFRITALAGSSLLEQVPITSALFVEGWEDLRFPVQGINPAGATDAPTVETTLTGYPGTLLFSGSADNVIAGIAQLPHGWKVGSAVRPHIHWSKPVGSASEVSWVFYYRILGSAGDAHGAWVGPVAGTLAAGSMATANEMLLTAFGEVDLTGQRESTCLNWQLRRLGSSDADNGAARLFELDFHYQTDKAGTVNEIPA